MVHGEITPFFFLIIIFNTLSYVIAISLAMFMYKKYRYAGHSWLGTSFFLLFAAYLLRVLANFVPENQVATTWTASNILLMPGILGLILVSLLSQYDRLPTRAHFITLLVGTIMGLLASSSNVTITVDESGINAAYSPLVALFSLVLLMFFIIFILRPLIIKIRADKSAVKQTHVILLIIAYVLLVLWVLSTAFTTNDFVRNIRPLTSALGILFWGLSLLSNPLSLAFSSTKVRTVIIANRVGVPLISVDMLSGEETEATLLMGLLSAVKSSMESIVGDNSSLRSILFQDSLLFFVPGKYTLLIFVLEGNITSNLELLGKVYLEEFEKEYHSELSSDIDAVYPDVFAPEIGKIKKVMHEIYV